MAQEIKYIGFYDLPDSTDKRVSNLAASNKMDYICEGIYEAGYNIHIVSPSWLIDNENKFGFIKSRTKRISDWKRITFCPSIYPIGRYSRNFSIFVSLVWLFVWLLKNVRKDEKILVYHVQWLSLPIRFAKRIKGFHLILEVEEIYSKVWNVKTRFNKWEEKLLNSADSYIAVSDKLAKELGSKVKAIVYGSYKLPSISFANRGKSEQNEVNIVYAGSIDRTKGGAFKALECATLLPDNYIVHILGGGGVQDVEELLIKLKEVNSLRPKIKCFYHGIKLGDDYSTFLMNCEIAINPQNEGEYMNTAFPSKVISYLSHNLIVVSSPIESIIDSKVASSIIFSKSDNASDFADGIMSIDFMNKNRSDMLMFELNNEFVEKLKIVFK